MSRKLALLAALCAGSLFGQNASGTLTLNGTSYELKHAYAFQVPDWTDKEKLGTKVLVTDKEIPAKLLKPKFDSFALRDAGITGLSMEFYSEGSSYAMNLIGGEPGLSFSLSGSFEQDRFKTLTADRVELDTTTAERELGSTNLAYTMSFAADVVPHVEVPAYVPNQADMDAAAKAETTKAFLAFHEAMRKGDIEALKGMVVPDRAEMMNDPDFKEMFEFVQEMMAKDVKVLRAEEDGDEAELLLSGTMMDKENERGKVELQRINGKWLIGMERWGDID